MAKMKRKGKPFVRHAESRGSAVRIYTDGSCLRNPAGPGGWAFVVALDPGTTGRSGHDPCTTNNRMEIMGVLEAMKYARTHHYGLPVDIYTDSEYVRCACEQWLDGWKRRGWKRAEGELLNKDLWQEVYEARSLVNARFLRVPGHSGHALNELADQYAGEAARGNCVDTVGGATNLRLAKIVIYDESDPEPMSSFHEDVLVGV